jgi:hypothetical protein
MAAARIPRDDSWQLFRADGSKVDLASLHVTCYAHFRRKTVLGELEPCRVQITWEQFVESADMSPEKEVVGEFRALAGNPPRLGERLVLRHAGHEVDGIVGGQGEAGPSQFQSTGGLRELGWDRTAPPTPLADEPDPAEMIGKDAGPFGPSPLRDVFKFWRLDRAEWLRSMAAGMSAAEPAEPGLGQPVTVEVATAGEHGPCQECRTRPAVAPIAHPVHGTYWVCGRCGDHIRNRPAAVEGKR